MKEYWENKNWNNKMLEKRNISKKKKYIAETFSL
jgi:hypothetical protein